MREFCDGIAADAADKERALQQWLRTRRSVVLGYSGGVDSTYLAALAVEALAKGRFLAVIGRSASYPESQWRDARAVAGELGIVVREVETRELEDPDYAANPVNRCYFCKRELWRKLSAIAKEFDLATIVDGTNADDLRSHRPGRAAAEEFGVQSPLALFGFTKDEIRARLRARGISSWRAPSSPCLSSRIPYGLPVTRLRLARVERAEAALRELGFHGDLRVRCHDMLARLELDPDAFELCMRPGMLQSVREAVLGSGFDRVAIDAVGYRSGSLNVLAGITGETQ